LKGRLGVGVDHHGLGTVAEKKDKVVASLTKKVTLNRVEWRN